MVRDCCCARCSCAGRALRAWIPLTPHVSSSCPAPPNNTLAIPFPPSQGALARPDRGMRWPAFRWSGGGDAPVLLAHMKANAIRSGALVCVCACVCVASCVCTGRCVCCIVLNVPRSGRGTPLLAESVQHGELSADFPPVLSHLPAIDVQRVPGARHGHA